MEPCPSLGGAILRSCSFDRVLLGGVAVFEALTCWKKMGGASLSNIVRKDLALFVQYSHRTFAFGLLLLGIIGTWNSGL